ncbi:MULTISPECIES: ABC transporter ATP-binding protein [Prauserella salsuginis group]|uniref:ABC transporter ATP-binding protein n=1 Tax=Prauserella salsuginis TaxID=387889 RepID=A0ABW6G1B8_9PSEU|nr:MULTISPECIES: ABC transporter ATP-binding protein [Prauserella salsuginis group]MCR3722140.1 peptide/nickel transport system ATP-binding protein [Prauserella flava]MCR3736137.1 peptide/nickel transport system ATP-binding protein [Prauserella salsuginis]
MSLLELTDIAVEYRAPGRDRVRAVDGVSLEVRPGEIVGLVGESGCGKSSLARFAAGLAAPTGGGVRLHGEAVSPLGRRRRRRAEIGLQMVFQNPYSSLNPRRTVLSQLLDGVPAEVGSRAERRRDALDRLTRVGLDEAAAERYPHQFSGGQLQRIAIARALAARPRVLVADEPVTALDVSSQAQVVEVLAELVEQLEVGMLFISHDLALVRRLADTTAVMYLGRLVETGPTERVWRRPKHPYTRALIDAIPSADPDAGLPRVLNGDINGPGAGHGGCRFRARCTEAFAACGDEPELTGDDHAVACWLDSEDTERVA